MVDEGLSSRWLNPSLETAATGSPQVSPPSNERPYDMGPVVGHCLILGVKSKHSMKQTFVRTICIEWRRDAALGTGNRRGVSRLWFSRSHYARNGLQIGYDTNVIP